MSYKRIMRVEILEVIRRYFDGQNISQIAKATGFDRKTVRTYIEEVTELGVKEYERDKIADILEEVVRQQSGRPNKSIEAFQPYEEEIAELINSKDNPVKPKTAYELIVERHELGVSYSSFKRFIRQNKLIVLKDKTTCRLEYEAGSQAQIDYAKMGTLIDPLMGKRKTVYAFIGSLSYSRHKYVDFVYSQNQQSFVASHVKMFNYFGGAPKVLQIDNLKSGVIKPDLYDPTLNRAYAEFAEYYECFINPCRVATPKDKPIVERDVQTIREQFRKLKAKNPTLTLQEANDAIREWLTKEYGERKHGTTHLKPMEEFSNVEQKTLLPLPIEPFEAAYWKEAVVHPDHFIQVQKKAYSVQHQYVGKKVWVKVTHNLVSVYYNEQLIKQHTIPNGYRQTDLNDFPENMQGAMDRGLPLKLRVDASKICDELGMLIDKILSPHAYINMRKAQGILAVAKKHPAAAVSKASLEAIVNYKRITPKIFLSLIETEPVIEEQIIISEETTGFIREMDYFIYNN